MDSHKNHKTFIQMAKRIDWRSGHNVCWSVLVELPCSKTAVAIWPLGLLKRRCRYMVPCSVLKKVPKLMGLNHKWGNRSVLGHICNKFSGSNWIHMKLIFSTEDNWKKSKSWGHFWSYQLNSTANPAPIPQNWAKVAKLAVLFSW